MSDRIGHLGLREHGELTNVAGRYELVDFPDVYGDSGGE